MKPAGLTTTEPKNSTDHRFGLSLLVAPTNSYQLWSAPDAFGLIRKEEETLALILDKIGFQAQAIPRISKRQLSVNFGTLLRFDPQHSFKSVKN